mgnify:CR=1 FL=1
MEYLGKWNGKRVIKVNRNDYSPLERDVYQVVMYNSRDGYLIEDNYHAIGKVSIENGQYVIDSCEYNLKEWFFPKKIEVKTEILDEWNPDTSIVDKFFEELEKIEG